MLRMSILASGVFQACMYVHQAKRQGKGAGDEPEDPYKEFMDEELDFREAQKRLQFVDATVNLAADYFDRVRHLPCPP